VKIIDQLKFTDESRFAFFILQVFMVLDAFLLPNLGGWFIADKIGISSDAANRAVFRGLLQVVCLLAGTGLMA
jgi:hypothetical protein